MDKDIIIPVTAIIPTADRGAILFKTLESIAHQNFQPFEIIIVDATPGDTTLKIGKAQIPGLFSKVIVTKAVHKGAAVQRIQGLQYATQLYILFTDDDIILEPGCIEFLWKSLISNDEAGATNVLVTNQHYHPPGKLTGIMYRLMHGSKINSYAGKCIGPAWNLLPEQTGESALCNEVEWINTTCSLYRKIALPTPLFPEHFKGYSLMEDLALSLTVSRNWKLYNVPDARIFHDSQPGKHKNSAFKLSKMELVNRHYIMKYIMKREGFSYTLKLTVFELWGILSGLTSLRGWLQLFPDIFGKLAGMYSIITNKYQYV